MAPITPQSESEIAAAEFIFKGRKSPGQEGRPRFQVGEILRLGIRGLRRVREDGVLGSVEDALGCGAWGLACRTTGPGASPIQT